MFSSRLSSLLGFRSIIAAAAVMIALMTIMATSFWLSRKSDSGSMFILPIPAQVAAIVELIESSSPEQRSLALKAVNSGSFEVYIAANPGVVETRSGIAFKAFRRAVANYTDALDGRRVFGMVGNRLGDFAAPEEGDAGLEAQYPMRLVVELTPTEYLVIQTPDILDARLRRIPAGLLVGLAAFVVAILALLAILTEVRPIGDMARSARSFAQFGRPKSVKPGGSKELRNLIDEFNHMQDRIAQLMASRTLIMSGMSHDVRTYLTRLRLRIESLEEDDRDAAARSIDAIQSLLDDTLALAEMESSEPQDEEVFLGEMLQDIANSYGSTASLIHIGSGCELTLYCRRSRLERAFINIIQNGLKYAGGVEIYCEKTVAGLQVVFMDRGPGISDAEKDKVLDPFYRSDKARNLNVSGSGLGLSIAKMIIERQGGHIELRDREGGGLQVLVILPLS